MLIRNANGWALKGARPVGMHCPKCGNTGDHVVWVSPEGLQIGFIFSRKVASTNKKWYLACPICGNFSSQLTHEQANALRGPG